MSHDTRVHIASGTAGASGRHPFQKAALICLEICLLSLVVFIFVARVKLTIDRTIRLPLIAVYADSLWAWFVTVYFNAMGYAAFKALASRKAGFLVLNGFVLVAIRLVLYRVIPLGVISGFTHYTLSSLEAIGNLCLLLAVVLLIVGFASVLRTGTGRARASRSDRRPPDGSAIARKVSVLIGISFVLSSLVSFWVIFVNTQLSMFRFQGETARVVATLLSYLAEVLMYMVLALVLQLLAIWMGRTGLATGNAKVVRLAGIFAVAGGLQHASLVGLPAVWAGVCLIKEANALEREMPDVPRCA